MDGKQVKTYASCPVCEREMKVGGSCAYNAYSILDAQGALRGKYVMRIHVGHAQDLMWVAPDEACHDCNAGYGRQHHAGCDAETCPVCGGQAMGCECLEMQDADGEASNCYVILPSGLREE